MRSSLASCFLFTQLSVSAAFSWNSGCDKAADHILHLRFKAAREIIASEHKAGNTIAYFLENYIDFLTLAIGEEKGDFMVYNSVKRERMKKIEADPVSSSWKKYCLAEIELQSAFGRLKFGENLTAAKEINRAYHILEKLLASDPEFLPAKKSMGLLHCLIGSVPGKYNWLTDLKGLKGSIPEGRSGLLYVIRNGATPSWLKKEAIFYLSFIQLNLDNHEETAKAVIGMIGKEDMSSPLMIYAFSSLSLRQGNNNAALEKLSDYVPESNAYPFYYMQYLKGLCLLHRADTACRIYFRSFLEKFKGRTFLKSAWQKLAWSYLISNDTLNYSAMMIKMKNSGTSIIDEDKLASKELESGERPHPDLLLSRLLFDGGDYQGSLKVLTKKKPSETFLTVKQQAEATYRLARIWHKMGKIADAISVYSMVVKNYSAEPWYFAANAALNLALICEAAGENEQAAGWFKKCLAVKGHEYKESLDQKAKAGLNRLRVN